MKIRKPSELRNDEKLYLTAVAVIVVVVGLIAALAHEKIKNNRLHMKVSEATVKINAHEEEKQTAIDIAVDAAVERGKEEARAEIRKLDEKPFMPVLTLAPQQNALCLAIATYDESRGEVEAAADIAWGIVNRAVDRRDTRVFRNSVCGVVAARKGTQYSGIGKYLKVIEKIVWGDVLVYNPAKAKDDQVAWDKIYKLSKEIIAGKRVRTTIANHHWSPKAADKHVPTWIAYLKPVGSAGSHLLFTDNVIIDGKQVVFTKENPYNPKKHGV